MSAVSFTVTERKDLPVLATFPQGLPPALASEDSGAAADEAELRAQLFKNGDARKQHQRMLVVDTPLTVYRGVNFGAANATHCTYAIGVVRSGKGQLLPVAHLYSMSGQRRSPLGEEPSATAAPPTDYKTQQQQLVERFGSKKRKRDVKSRVANQVAVSDVLAPLSQVLDAKHEAVEDEASVLQATKEAQLPPFDVSTTDVASIYPLGEIISDGEWEALSGTALMKAVSKSTSAPPAAHPEFGRFILAAAGYAKSRDPSQFEYYCRVLTYLSSLITWKRMPDGRKAKGLAELACPASVRESIREKFLEKIIRNGKAVSVHTPGMAGRLLCYIVVVALTACSFRVSQELLDLLATDLGMKAADLLTYFRECGCDVIKNTGVVLKAPLTLPSFRKKRAKRGA